MSARERERLTKKRAAAVELGEFVGGAESVIYFVRVKHDRRSGSCALRAFMCIEGDSVARPREVTHFFRDILGVRQDTLTGGFCLPYLNMDPAFHAVDVANRAMVDAGAPNAGTLRRDWL